MMLKNASRKANIMKEKTKGFVIGVLATVAVASVINVAAEEIYKNVAIAYNNIKICITSYSLQKYINSKTRILMQKKYKLCIILL